MYVNKDLRLCINYTSCVEIAGLHENGTCTTSNCTKNNTKVNGETCMNINDCPNNKFVLEKLVTILCVNYNACLSDGRYAYFNENTCITWKECYDKGSYINEE